MPLVNELRTKQPTAAFRVACDVPQTPPRLSLDAAFCVFRSRFVELVESRKHDDQRKRMQVADLIELDDWCGRFCLLVCRDETTGDPHDLARAVLDWFCDGIRKGNARVLTWRGARGYFKRAFRTLARRTEAKRRKRRECVGITMNTERVSHEPEPIDNLIASEDVELLERLLIQIRHSTWKSIVWLRRDGLSFKQIAEKLEMGLEAAERAYYRCMVKLKRRVQELGLSRSQSESS